MESHTTRGSDRQQILARCRFCVRCGVDAGQWKTGETWSNGSACYVFPFSFFFLKNKKKRKFSSRSILSFLRPPLSSPFSFCFILSFGNRPTDKTRLYRDPAQQHTHRDSRLYLSSLFLFPFLIISVAIKYLQQMNRCATRFSFFDLTAANACQISHYTTSWFQEIPGIVSIRDIESARKRACCWPFLPFSHQDQ